nr:hypothetical protein CFP56_55234 [Quercus suber]
MANTYQYLVDKIQKKIEGWQAKYLSVASCVTLIKSSVASIPLYAMQTTLLLQKAIEEALFIRKSLNLPEILFYTNTLCLLIRIKL